jgi:hypothetical protein
MLGGRRCRLLHVLMVPCAASLIDRPQSCSKANAKITERIWEGLGLDIACYDVECRAINPCAELQMLPCSPIAVHRRTLALARVPD